MFGSKYKFEYLIILDGLLKIGNKYKNSNIIVSVPLGMVLTMIVVVGRGGY